MSYDYTLNWTDDSLKDSFDLPGKSVDSSTTSLRLNGKGSVNWGENFQENLLHLLEHFASASSPTSPTLGQIWFNSDSNYLNVQTADGWKELATRRIDSTVAPVTSVTGDVWYDTTTNIFKVYTGSTWVRVGSDSADIDLRIQELIDESLEQYDETLQIQLPTLTVDKANNIIGGTAGSIPYQSAINATTMLPPGDDTMVLTLAGGLPVWAPGGAGASIGSGAPDGAGQIAYFSGSYAPAGFIKANGAVLDKRIYPELYAAIGNVWCLGPYNAGNRLWEGSTWEDWVASNYFFIPDLRGIFIRGLDDGAGNDLNRPPGSYQVDALKAHTHYVTDNVWTPSVGPDAVGGGQEPRKLTNYGAADTYSNNLTSSTGGTETRPKNVAMIACIRYTAAGQVAGPAGPAGPAGGPTGPAGADSTVVGPTGPTGPTSTVPGPTGSTGLVGVTTNRTAYTATDWNGYGYALVDSSLEVASAGVLRILNTYSPNANCTYNCNCTCVPAGTLVTLADGRRIPIEQVMVGDEVKTENGVGTVLNFWQPLLGNRALWEINGTLLITGDHLVKTTDGWACVEPELVEIRKTEGIAPDVPFDRLVLGATLKTDQGDVAVASIKQVDAPATLQLYSLFVSGAAEFYANGVLVDGILTPNTHITKD